VQTTSRRISSRGARSHASRVCSDSKSLWHRTEATAIGAMWREALSVQRPLYLQSIPEQPQRSATFAPAAKRAFRTAMGNRRLAVGTTIRTASSIATRRYDSRMWHRAQSPANLPTPARSARRAAGYARMRHQLRTREAHGARCDRVTRADARWTHGVAAEKCRSAAVQTTSTEASPAVHGAMWPAERPARPPTPTRWYPDLPGNHARTRAASA
jgi:hypothetical protein